MKKPDRFQRMAEVLRLEHIASPWSRQIPLEAWDGIEYRIAQLLRRQYAAIVRMVKRDLKNCENIERAMFEKEGNSARWHGWNCRVAACRQLLGQLARRRR